MNTFVLCIGAPKAGTTWLYHYLKSYDCVDLGFKKEYHVFDVAYVDYYQYFAKAKSVDVKLRSLEFYKKSDKNQKLLSSFRDNHELYFNYFDSLLVNGKKITGDITPTYLNLPHDIFSLIRDSFEQRGTQVKVIFFMRDPVERIISVAKMGKRFGKILDSNFDRNANINDILNSLYKLPHIVGNTDYKRTVNLLESVFPAGNIHSGFYETMFRKSEIFRLSNFLELKPKYEMANIKFNAASEQHNKNIHPGLIKKIRVFYDEQYRFMKQKFPQQYLDHIWPYLD